jgi:hypothetical protein
VDFSAGDDQTGNERWPEKGQMTFKVDDNGCVEEHTFGSKAELCMGLMDEAINKSCSRKGRRSHYQAICGDDFEPRNVQPMTLSGWDPRLGQACALAPAGVDRFARLGDYCNYLKDEYRHSYCHWASRYDEFLTWNCTGDFSPMPQTKPTPPPPPPPRPTPYQPPQEERPQIVKELEAAGIRVDYNPNGSGGPRIPGDEPFPAKLRRFWPVLAELKSMFIARRNVLSQISLDEWTEYDSQKRELSLDPSLNRDDVISYLTLLDKRIALEANTGISFDFGIEVYGHERGLKTQDLANTLGILENHRSELKDINSVIRHIKRADYSHLWYDDTRTLQLKGSAFEAELVKYVGFLKPTSPFFQFANSVGLKVSFDTEIDDHLPEFTEGCRALYQTRDTLQALAQAGKLKQIEVNINSQTYPWYASETLTANLSSKDPRPLQQAIEALGVVTRFESASQIPVKWSGIDLDAGFIESARKLKERSQLIQAKKKSGKIESIYFTNKSSYSAGYRSLEIGSDDALADLDRILASIR